MDVSGNLFDNIPDYLPDEAFEVLMRGRGDFFVERILSSGHASPPGFWYEQETAEWVLLLGGEAVIEFEENKETILRVGDWLEIPPRVCHRVKRTREGEVTVWLAVHWKPDRVAQNAS